MPDAPFATTLSLAMGKWAQGKNPGASALNANWDKIDAAALAHGVMMPAPYQVGKLFLKDDDMVIFRNDGTQNVPIWTAILDVGTLAGGLAAKAPQSQVDTIQASVNELETDVTDLEAADFVKRAGTPALTGDLDFGTHKAKGLAAGVNPDEGVNVGQLAAAIAAVSGLLGSQTKALVTRGTDQVNGASPTAVTWGATIYASAGMVNLGTDPTKVKITVDGYYRINTFCIITDTGVGGLTDGNAAVVLNGVTQLDVQVAAVAAGYAGNGPWLRIMTPLVHLVPGDYLELKTAALTGAGAHTVVGSVWPTYMMVFLEVANAPGGGDFLANGTIPMTAPIDLGGFRATHSADAVNPLELTTLQQVQAADEDLQDQIDAIVGGAALAGDQRRLTGGDQGFSTGTWELVTGSAMTFTLAVSKFIAIDGNGSALMDFEHRANLQLGIRLQKTGDSAEDIPGTMCYDALGYYVNGSVVASEKRTLVAGEWTISLIAKKISGFPNNPILGKTAPVPAYIGYVLTG